jgi:universal stress protein A
MAETKTQAKTPKSDVIGRVQSSYPRIRRILVPLDFSGKSRRALSYAAPLAVKFGARLVLLHVLSGEKPERGQAAPPPNSPRRNAAHKRLRETALQFVDEDLIDQTVVRSGRPAREIIETARVLNADLLAITTEAKAGLNRLIKGSTAEQVLRLSPCPVLAVRKR